MANDNQKLTAQMIDLNRSMDKLAGEIKKNTTATQEISESQQDADKAKSQDLKSLIDSLSSLKDLKGLTDEIKKLDLGNLSKTLGDLPGALSGLTKGPLSSLIGKGTGEKIGNILGGAGKGFNVGKILGGFQEGGVAKKEGQYVVGENGPEVVKLPAGAAVIPLDIKDFITGLAKVPELADLVKNKEINFYGDRDEASIVKGDGKDLKNRISLEKLKDKYEDALDDQESLDKAKQDPTVLASLKEQNKIIRDLIGKGNSKVQDSIQANDSEYYKIWNSSIKWMDKDQLKTFNSIWDKAIASLPKEAVNDLTISRTKLLALESLSKLNKPSESKETAKTVDLAPKAETKNVDAKKKEAGSGPTVEAKPEVLKTATESIKGAATEGIKNNIPKIGDIFSAVGGDSALGKKGSDIVKKAGGLLSSELGKNLGGIGGAGNKITDFLGKGTVPGGTEFKKTITSLGSFAKNPQTGIEKNIEKFTSDISGLLKSKSPLPPSKTADSTSEQSGGLTPGASEGSVKKDESGKDEKGKPKDMQSEIDAIKGLLARVASALEGTLDVSMMENPFRPDSRKV